LRNVPSSLFSGSARCAYDQPAAANFDERDGKKSMDLVNSIVKAVRILDLLKGHGSLSYTEILKMFPLPKAVIVLTMKRRVL